MNRAVRGWFTVAAALALASVVMGAVVCATESGASCPNWPGCYLDQFLPTPAAGLSTNPLIEFAHRVVAGLTGPVVLVTAILGRRLSDPRPRRLAWIALAGTLSAGLFGMLIVKVGIPWWLGVLDLGSALAATVCLLLARVLLVDGARWKPGRAARLSWTALGGLAAMHLLALPVAGAHSYTRCMGWPVLVLGSDHWPVLQWARVGLAVLATVLIVVAAVREFRSGGRVVAVLPVAAVALELIVGLAMVAGSGGVGVRTVHSVTAVVAFWCTALLAARSSAGVVAPASASEAVGSPGRR